MYCYIPCDSKLSSRFPWSINGNPNNYSQSRCIILLRRDSATLSKVGLSSLSLKMLTSRSNQGHCYLTLQAEQHFFEIFFVGELFWIHRVFMQAKAKEQIHLPVIIHSNIIIVLLSRLRPSGFYDLCQSLYSPSQDLRFFDW